MFSRFSKFPDTYKLETDGKFILTNAFQIGIYRVILRRNDFQDEYVLSSGEKLLK